MAKKTFGQGFDLILGEEEPLHIPEVKEQLTTTSEKKVVHKIPEKKILSTKITVRINNHLLEQLKQLAYWDRKTITEIINDALRTHINANINKISN